MHRFVVAGSQLKEAVVPQSAGRFKFDGVYGLNAIEVPIIQDNRELTLYTRIAKARWGGGGGGGKDAVIVVHSKFLDIYNLQ